MRLKRKGMFNTPPFARKIKLISHSFMAKRRQVFMNAIIHIARLAAVALIILPLNGYSQNFATLWSETLPVDSLSAAVSAAQRSDKGIFFWETRYQQLCLLTLDSLCQTKSVNKYQTMRKQYPLSYGVTPTNDGGCVGTYMDDSGTGISYYFGNIIRIDKQGVETWRKSIYFGYGKGSWNSCVGQLPDGGFVVADIFCVDTIWVQKFSSSGDSVWYKKLGFPHVASWADHLSFIVTPRGTIVLTFSQAKEFTSPPSTDKDNVRLLEMNSAGEVIREKTFITEDTLRIFRSILPAKDNGYFLAGIQLFSNWDYYYCVMHVDSLFNVIWVKSFKTFPPGSTNKDINCRLVDMVEINDSIIAVGGFEYDNRTYNSNLVLFAMNHSSGSIICRSTRAAYWNVSYLIPGLSFFNRGDNFPLLSYVNGWGSRNYSITLSKIGLKYSPSFITDPLQMERTIREKELYVDSVKALDTFPLTRLRYRLGESSPQTMRINDTTGVIQWLPGNKDTGSIRVTVIVADQIAQSDTLSYILNIQQTNVAIDRSNFELTAKGRASLRNDFGMRMVGTGIELTLPSEKRYGDFTFTVMNCKGAIEARSKIRPETGDRLRLSAAMLGMKGDKYYIVYVQYGPTSKLMRFINFN